LLTIVGADALHADNFFFDQLRGALIAVNRPLSPISLIGVTSRGY
jgi:hypothetical protein